VRVAGLDVGKRRIGVAVSDPSGLLARPLQSVRVSGLGPASVEHVVDALSTLVQEDDGLALVVVGLPRHLDGTSSELTAEVQGFARLLERRLHVPVVFQDERLSSVEAESRLARGEKDWRARKRKLDAAAAAVILQDYLDERHEAPVLGDIH